jgi:hypothetical protein
MPATATPILMTIRPAPRREPLFDDELPANVVRLTRYDRPLPFDRPSVPESISIRPVADPDLPDPTRWASSMLIGIIETANGRRPARQLGHMFTATIAARVLADLTTRRGGRPHWLHAASIRSVRAMQPCPGVAEISATLTVASRVRAVALRVERRHDQWRCTRLHLG